METLKTTALSLAFILCFTMWAKADPTEKSKRSIDYTLNKYIECTAHGNFEDFSSLLNNSFKQCVTYGQKTMTYNKKQIVDYMKKTKNIIQNCTVAYSMVENNLSFSIAKIEMKYPTFTRIDYVTMSNGKEGWDITNIFTTYP